MRRTARSPISVPTVSPSDYRLIGGQVVTLLVARYQPPDAPVRTTADADVGVRLQLVADGGFVDELCPPSRSPPWPRDGLVRGGVAREIRSPTRIAWMAWHGLFLDGWAATDRVRGRWPTQPVTRRQWHGVSSRTVSRGQPRDTSLLKVLCSPSDVWS